MCRLVTYSGEEGLSDMVGWTELVTTDNYIIVPRKVCLIYI